MTSSRVASNASNAYDYCHDTAAAMVGCASRPWRRGHCEKPAERCAVSKLRHAAKDVFAALADRLDAALTNAERLSVYNRKTGSDNPATAYPSLWLI
jgi:hypothetical protein